jgi:2-oxoglutarate/2-oxoacid ferredoxin oxidoreductase subunit alpha
MTNCTSPTIDVTIELCGSAGDGSIAAGQILNHAVTFLGYHVMNFDSFPAEIRGFGKSVAHTRISNNSLHTPGRMVDCLVALNDPHSISNLALLKSHGVVIYDNKPMDYHEEDKAIAGFIEPGMIGYGAPLRELSITALKSAKSRNIVALGVLAHLFQIKKEAFHFAIAKRFKGKSELLINDNIKAFDLGYTYGSKLEKTDPVNFENKAFGKEKHITILSGNEAAARACLDADIRLYAGYPITPATKIMEILARKLPQQGGIVVQTEDEISAIGHIVGGGFAGKRCATATSGPGLCLMAEFLNLAVVAEIPIVVIDSQRAGPSTGLPTKTEQSDLNMAIFGATGDAPKPVLAPSTVEECYSLVLKAFELAEAFQTPVLVLLDFFLSNRMEDINLQKITSNEYGTYGKITAESSPGYKRYQLTESGISPQALPGQEGFYYTSTGLEHNEQGMPDYSPENHQQMNNKRHTKLATLGKQWPEAECVGDGDLAIGIVSWGSSIGAAREAIERLTSSGIKVGGFFPRLLWPVDNAALKRFSNRCNHLAVVEMNWTGQFASIVEQISKRHITKICQVYSAPFPVADIVDAAVQLLQKEQ